jgi:hypothetical protein
MQAGIGKHADMGEEEETKKHVSAVSIPYTASIPAYLYHMHIYTLV